MSLSSHARAILALGLPLAGSHLAQFAVGVVDVIMMGWYGIDALAAVVLGSTFFFLLFIFGAGFAGAVMPMVAEAEAAGNETEVRRATRMGLWISLGFAALMLPLFLWSEPLLRILGQKPELAGLARTYLVVVGFQLAPALLVMVLKNYLSALERTQFILWMTVGGAVLNGFLNWVLIFGNLGAPEMGIRGCALASLTSHSLTLVVIVLYAGLLPDLRKYALFQRMWRPDPDALRRVFVLGLPIGLTLLAEVALFSAATFMFGWIGTNALAAHGIAIQIASATFMVHLGLSNAATVRAGRALGRRDQAGLIRGVQVATALSLIFALITVAVFVSFPQFLVGLFLDPANPERNAIVPIGAGLLVIAGVFQVVDGVQVMSLGALRGVQDTRVPMVLAAISYWLIGVPVSYTLAFHVGWGGAGIWWGLVVGLAAAALFLTTRFWTKAVHIG